MDSISGIPLYVNQYACKLPEFVRWRRTHKKARIAKKWRKRYGAVMSTCPGVYVLMGKTAHTKESIVVCPCWMEQWKKYGKEMVITRQEVLEDREREMTTRAVGIPRSIDVDDLSLMMGQLKYEMKFDWPKQAFFSHPIY